MRNKTQKLLELIDKLKTDDTTTWKDVAKGVKDAGFTKNSGKQYTAGYLSAIWGQREKRYGWSTQTTSTSLNTVATYVSTKKPKDWTDSQYIEYLEKIDAESAVREERERKAIATLMKSQLTNDEKIKIMNAIVL